MTSMSAAITLNMATVAGSSRVAEDVRRHCAPPKPYERLSLMISREKANLTGG
jgi:hypothetical protein